MSTAPKLTLFGIFAALVAIVAVLFWGVATTTWSASKVDTGEGDTTKALMAKVDTSKYQGVYLTGGLTYYGKLQAEGDTLEIADPYYLTPPSSADPAGRLVSRSNQLDGPTSPVTLAPSQVVYVENINPNSEIAKAIKQILTKPSPTPTPK